jgi:hypothetical protein
MSPDTQTTTLDTPGTDLGGAAISATDLRLFPCVPPSTPHIVNWTAAQQEADFPENSTAYQQQPEALCAKMAALFAVAKDEYFEDGMESEFSRGLIRLIGEYGEKAVIELAFLILHDQVNAEIAAEALRWLGHMEDRRSYQRRLWLLERNLFTSSVRIRDGAVLGLTSLDDPHAIRYLRRAMNQEPYPELRRDMEQVLAQLETGS